MKEVIHIFVGNSDAFSPTLQNMLKDGIRQRHRTLRGGTSKYGPSSSVCDCDDVFGVSESHKFSVDPLCLDSNRTAHLLDASKGWITNNF
jgi:hypothetical protein